MELVSSLVAGPVTQLRGRDLLPLGFFCQKVCWYSGVVSVWAQRSVPFLVGLTLPISS